MRAAPLLARRSGVRRSLLLALAAVVAVTTFLLSGMVEYLAAAADTAVRESLTAGPPTTRAVQLSTRLAPESEQQAEAIGALITDAFTGIDVDTSRTVRSNPAPAIVGGGAVDVVVLAGVDLAEEATLVDGEWPGDSSAAAVQASAAETLGLTVGDEFTVGGHSFTVAATWLPTDATRPVWFGDPAVASGRDRLSYGPVVVGEGALADLRVRSYAQWTIVPDPEALTAAELPRLAQALEELPAALDRSAGGQNLEVSGAMADRVEQVQRSLGVAGALVTIPAALVAVIGLIALAQLVRLLATVRRSETALLRARGASVTQVTVMSLAEAVLAIVAGSVLGGLITAVLLGAGLALSGSALAAAWPVALAVAVVSLAVWGVLSWRAALVGAGPLRGDSGRVRASVTAGATVLVLAAAGVSLWQFKLYGSPLIADREGGLRVDPVTVVAPALALLSLAMLGLFAFGPVARRLERWAERSRGILPVLPVRHIARGAPVFGVVMLLITLAVSGSTLAAVYSSTWSTSSSAAARLANGADVRVRLSPPGAVEGPSSLVTTVPYLGLPGVDDAATVLRTPVRVADDSLGLTAMAADRMPAVMQPVPDAVDPSSLASALTAERTGVRVPGGVDALSLTVQVTAPPGPAAGVVEVLAWIEDSDASLALVSLGSTAVAQSAPATLAVSPPEGRLDEWTMLAVEARLSAADGARGVQVRVSGLGTDHQLTLSSIDPADRAIAYPELSELPVVVTEQLAARLSLQHGSTLDARIPSTASAVTARVAGVTPAVPASDGRLAVIADLGSLNRYLLQSSERIPQPSEVWISAPDGEDLVAPAVAASTTTATVTTLANRSQQQVIAPALVALWWGTAGAALLAAVALLAITGTFSRERRNEVVVLRTLGMSGAEQGRNRLIEVVGVAAAAAVTGVVSGLVVAAATVSELSATAVGASVPVALRFDVLGWVTVMFALLAAVVTISTSYASRVAVQARDTEYAGELR